jgi:hypothetical protein
MRAEVPDGDLATLIERTVTEKLKRLEARRYGLTQRPRAEERRRETTSVPAERAPVARHIPAAIRRAVYRRDGDRCVYVEERPALLGAPSPRIPPSPPVRARG